MNADLEFLREVFKDDRLHIGIGTITQLGLSQDGNTLRAQVNLLPENREVVCVYTWDDIGRISFPEVDDLVLVAFCDGLPDEAHVIRQLTNGEEPISAFGRLGHMISNSRPGKKNYIGSDTKVSIGRIDVEGNENLVLGQQIKSLLSSVLDAISSHKHVYDDAGTPSETQPPDNASAFTSAKATVDSGSILSDIAFTEKGS